ncbi:MAG: Beta-lactamase domain protein [Candidatus Beckwithbacteria bacterium GW2011_GWA2_43_10]|uniref:Beta-lactamase domain protein n=1 Tax=Candidatus Beckwithbacteria bacterium GW2011_GWA2_43_10 TaxID=1618369 RepID=A0A0G1C3P1_9BACT|nr:MAG: Beta-lactamase domain protein [Candidatus Beckwithbacteria bacterium GW2011_GWA2_43_10]
MNTLRVIPLGGGPGAVTNNMYLYEYGHEALIVDCGIGFPEDKASDNIIIPDISYLKSKSLKIHGLLLTHGHDDHHAALPHILPQLGYVPLYGSRLTAGFAQDRLADFDLNQTVKVLAENDQLRLGPFIIDPIHVTHSVPDTFHYVIKTPVGAIYHGSDFKFDLTPLDNWPPNFKKIVSLSQKGILCLLSDCLRSERPGFTPSEITLSQALEREIVHCPGRLIFTTMSSQIHRIQQAIDIAIAHNRQICFIGRSMEKNTLTAQRLGFLKFSRKQVINPKRLKAFPDRKLCLIVAGSQGQETSSLTRYASGYHKLLKLKPTDKVVYSTDIIPGNEQAVYQVIDDLAQAGVQVAYQDTDDDLHVSGHASAGELQLLLHLVSPRYLYPIGGAFRHMRQYFRLAEELGYRQEQIIAPQTGQVVEFAGSGHFRLAETLKLEPILINQNELKK